MLERISEVQGIGLLHDVNGKSHPLRKAALIRDVVQPRPLVHAKNLVGELNEINEYVGQFHHDTNPGGANTVPVVTSELQTFVARAMHVFHCGPALV